MESRGWCVLCGHVANHSLFLLGAFFNPNDKERCMSFDKVKNEIIRPCRSYNFLPFL